MTFGLDSQNGKAYRAYKNLAFNTGYQTLITIPQEEFGKIYRFVVQDLGGTGNTTIEFLDNVSNQVYQTYSATGAAANPNLSVPDDATTAILIRPNTTIRYIRTGGAGINGQVDFLAVAYPVTYNAF